MHEASHMSLERWGSLSAGSCHGNMWYRDQSGKPRCLPAFRCRVCEGQWHSVDIYPRHVTDMSQEGLVISAGAPLSIDPFRAAVRVSIVKTTNPYPWCFPQVTLGRDPDSKPPYRQLRVRVNHTTICNVSSRTESPKPRHQPRRPHPETGSLAHEMLPRR